MKKNYDRLYEKIKINIRKNETKIELLMFVILTILFSVAIWIKNFNVALIAVMLWFVMSVMISMLFFEERILLLAMNGMIFLFLLSRPFIGMMKGKEWWYFEQDVICRALIYIYISLVALLAGYRIAENYIMRSKHKKIYILSKVEKYVSIQSETLTSKVLFALTVFSMIAVLYMGIDKYLFMHGKDYVELYMEYDSSRISIFVRTFATMGTYFLAFFWEQNLIRELQ